MNQSKEKRNVVVRIAGAAGDGIASAGEIFGKICARQGLHIMAYNSYQSAIRGGHVWLQLNVIDKDGLARAHQAGMLAVMNRCPAIEYGRRESKD